MNKLNKRDDLSAQLDRITAELDDSDRAQEKNQRTSLLSTLKNYTNSRFRLGQGLASYKQACRVDRIWLLASTAIGKHLGRSQRTVFRIVEDYERVVNTPEPILVAMKEEGFDAAEPKHAALLKEVVHSTPADCSPEQARRVVQQTAAHVKQKKAEPPLSEDERIVWGLRQDIRKRLNNIPDDQKWDLLERAIAEEAFEVWGSSEPWELLISPRPGARTLDGRQRRAQEVAA